jgi:hypothetical protein
MEFVRWATGANDPVPLGAQVAAVTVVLGGGLVLVLREWFR